MIYFKNLKIKFFGAAKKQESISTYFQLDLPNGLRISPDLTPSEVESVAGITKSDMNTGYIWYTFQDIEFDQNPLSVSFCFYEKHLSIVSIALTNDKYGTGWNDWTEEKEQQRAKDTAALLYRHGFQTGHYSWGTIESAYDPKGGAGSVVVTNKI